MGNRNVWGGARPACFTLSLALSVPLMGACSDKAEPEPQLTKDLTIEVRAPGATAADVVLLPGVAVALDRPDGTRVEQLTDAAGRTTFADVDFGVQRGALTLYLEGYSALSLVNLDGAFLDGFMDSQTALGAPDALVLFLQPLPFVPAEPPATVTATGTATSLTVDGTYNLVLAPLRAFGSFYAGAAASPFSFEVEPGRPFTLVAIEAAEGILPSNRGYWVEIPQLLSLDSDPLSADPSTLALDFATHGVTPSRASGSFALPARADSPLRSAWGIVWVKDRLSINDANIGWAEHIERAADGSSFDVSYLWTEPALVEEPFTQYLVYDNSYNVSYVFKPGYPEAGELSLPLLDVPRWTAPANPALPLRLPATFAWQLADDVPIVQLRIGFDDQVVWYVAAGPNATSATLPALPSVVDQAAFLGEVELWAVLWAGETDADQYWQRLAITQQITVIP